MGNAEDMEDAESKQEVVAPPPPPIILQGHVILVRRGIAYLGLRDPKGFESFGECNASILKAQNTFTVAITKHNGTVEVALQDRQLSKSEWHGMRATIESILHIHKINNGGAYGHGDEAA